MAQPKVDEEKKINIDESIDKIVIPIPDKAVIDKLPWKVKELYNYKAKYEINDDGSLTFYPTPSLARSKDPSDPVQSSPSAPLQSSVSTTLLETKEEAPTAIKYRPSVNVDSIGYINAAPKPASLPGHPPMAAPLPGAPSPMPAPLPGQAPPPASVPGAAPMAPPHPTKSAPLPGPPIAAPLPTTLSGLAPMAVPLPATWALPTVPLPLPGQAAKAPMAPTLTGGAPPKGCCSSCSRSHHSNFDPLSGSGGAPFPGSEIAFLPGQAPVPPPLPDYIAPMAPPRPTTPTSSPGHAPMAAPLPEQPPIAAPLPTTLPEPSQRTRLPEVAAVPLPTSMLAPLSAPLPGQPPIAASIPSPLSGDNEAPMAPTLSSTKKVTEQMMSAIRGEGCKEPACCSNSDAEIVESRSHSSICSFITSSLEAWNKHYPFRFKPEHIWLLILQAVAVHVDKNAEKLRNKYVTHEGKKDLIVEISRDPSYEEWVNTIQTFAAQIDENTVKDTCKILECDFSKSTLTEKIATKITMMDICKNYFIFYAMTCCGFPRITLDGNKQDWIKLKAKTVKLLNEKVTKKFGSQWGEALLPLLDRFIIAFDGNIDCLFWNSMIKRGAEHRSGGKSWYSGWFNILFPFVNKQWSKEWNEFCVPYAMDLDYVSSGDNNDYGKGVIPDNYPTGIASAPVTWIRQDIGKKFKMKFLAGFVGHTQDEESMEICPNVSWCIAYQEHL